MKLLEIIRHEALLCQHFECLLKCNYHDIWYSPVRLKSELWTCFFFHFHMNFETPSSCLFLILFLFLSNSLILVLFLSFPKTFPEGLLDLWKWSRSPEADSRACFFSENPEAQNRKVISRHKIERGLDAQNRKGSWSRCIRLYWGENSSVDVGCPNFWLLTFDFAAPPFETEPHFKRPR